MRQRAGVRAPRFVHFRPPYDRRQPVVAFVSSSRRQFACHCTRSRATFTWEASSSCPRARAAFQRAPKRLALWPQLSRGSSAITKRLRRRLSLNLELIKFTNKQTNSARMRAQRRRQWLNRGMKVQRNYSIRIEGCARRSMLMILPLTCALGTLVATCCRRFGLLLVRSFVCLFLDFVFVWLRDDEAHPRSRSLSASCALRLSLFTLNREP